MRFRFTGDPRGETPRSITAFGISFPAGEAVEVLDERVAAKLRGNSHFAEEAGDAAPGQPTTIHEAIDALTDKAQLEAFAKEAFGVDIDKRKSEATLRAELKALADGADKG